MRTDTAFIYLRGFRDKLTKQQYRTLKGQILAGDIDGAMRGLQKILERVSAG
mgnify:CR=1 FL=1